MEKKSVHLLMEILSFSSQLLIKFSEIYSSSSSSPLHCLYVYYLLDLDFFFFFFCMDGSDIPHLREVNYKYNILICLLMFPSFTSYFFKSMLTLVL